MSDERFKDGSYDKPTEVVAKVWGHSLRESYLLALQRLDWESIRAIEQIIHMLPPSKVEEYRLLKESLETSETKK